MSSIVVISLLSGNLLLKDIVDSGAESDVIRYSVS